MKIWFEIKTYALLIKKIYENNSIKRTSSQTIAVARCPIFFFILHLYLSAYKIQLSTSFSLHFNFFFLYIDLDTLGRRVFIEKDNER